MILIPTELVISVNVSSERANDHMKVSIIRVQNHPPTEMKGTVHRPLSYSFRLSPCRLRNVRTNWINTKQPKEWDYLKKDWFHGNQQKHQVSVRYILYYTTCISAVALEKKATFVVGLRMSRDGEWARLIITVLSLRSFFSSFYLVIGKLRGPG